MHPCHEFERIDAPLVPVWQSDLRTDPVPWIRPSGDNLHELSELHGTSLGVDEKLVIEWLAEDSQRVDNNAVVQQDESWVCTICMEGVEVGANGALVKICADGAGRAHIFHAGCLQRWLRNSNTCPICRRPDIIAESPDEEVTYYC